MYKHKHTTFHPQSRWCKPLRNVYSFSVPELKYDNVDLQQLAPDIISISVTLNSRKMWGNQIFS